MGCECSKPVDGGRVSDDDLKAVGPPGSPQSLKKSIQIRDGDDEAKRLGRRSSIHRKAFTSLEQVQSTDAVHKRRASSAKPKTPEERQRLAAATADCVLFNGLKGQTLDDVFDAMTDETIEKGTIVIRQGELGDV